jgi:hypothetical protein
MLHHVSFNAHDPAHVARVLAEMIGAQAIRAPSPPFPESAWFVCYGDEQASLLEILPWGTVQDLDVPGGIGFDAELRPRSGAHALVGGSRPADDVLAIAERAGWRAKLVNAGPFAFVKVSVENALVIEVLTPEHAPRYLEMFGTAGIARLDDQLRALESSLR